MNGYIVWDKNGEPIFCIINLSDKDFLDYAEVRNGVLEAMIPNVDNIGEEDVIVTEEKVDFLI